MRILALDIGLKRTGAAFAESDIGVPMALSTIHHESKEELADAVAHLIEEKKINHIVIGLPLLPAGSEGEQSSIVRLYAAKIADLGLPIAFLDERYTTHTIKEVDDNASSACLLLETAIKQGVDKYKN